MSRRPRRRAPSTRAACPGSLVVLLCLASGPSACDSPPPSLPDASSPVDAVLATPDASSPVDAVPAAPDASSPVDAVPAAPDASSLAEAASAPPDSVSPGDAVSTPPEPASLATPAPSAEPAASLAEQAPDAAPPDAVPSPEDAGSSTAGAAPLDGGAAAAPPGSSEGCPDDMVLVEGDYCPLVQQTCLKHHPEYVRDRARRALRDAGAPEAPSTVSERCLEYRKPSVCLSRKRTRMRYCIDRYEWPNKKGELPALLVSWRDAVKRCESVGKRLCTEEEFNFACEGEEMLPYTYGYVRDREKCNIDRPFRQREIALYKYERCMKDPKCKAELERLDQRVPAGSLPGCVSPFGVHDLNGNINEWVVRPGQRPPNRSGLKGGWWGPMRGRCRPTVGFHNEEDYGYEAGFRCCKDAPLP